MIMLGIQWTKLLYRVDKSPLGFAMREYLSWPGGDDEVFQRRHCCDA
jgi:hypothetical protein